MAYQHRKLGAAINHHFNGAPPAGINTFDGVLTRWHDANLPSEAEQSQWVADFLAAPPVPTLSERIDACSNLSELKALLKDRLRA